MSIVNPPSLDFVEIVNVSVNVPVFSTRITKSVSPPGSALWSFVTSSEVTPYVENNVCLTDAKKTQKI